MPKNAVDLDPVVLGHMYQAFNRKYFGARLPDVPVRWRRCGKRLMASCHYESLHEPGTWEIQINPDFAISSKIVGMILLHECVHLHLAVCKRPQGHGKYFQQEMQRLARQGAFRNFW